MAEKTEHSLVEKAKNLIIGMLIGFIDVGDTPEKQGNQKQGNAQKKDKKKEKKATGTSALEVSSCESLT